MKLIATAFLAVTVAILASNATSLVYAGATDRATCIDAMVSGKACDRGNTGAKWVRNEHFKGE